MTATPALAAQASAERVGGIIVVRVSGEPTPALLWRAQDDVLRLVRETGVARILYDCREMIAPPVNVPLAQRALDATLWVALRRAVVVPTMRLADLARLAFGEGSCRVFHGDVDRAVDANLVARGDAERESTDAAQRRVRSDRHVLGPDDADAIRHRIRMRHQHAVRIPQRADIGVVEKFAAVEDEVIAAGRGDACIAEKSARRAPLVEADASASRKDDQQNHEAHHRTMVRL
jgi:hypothetical protein